MSFLVSFVNVHKRIARSSESYMIFGGNVEETSDTVRKYINKLLSDLKYLESQVFNIDIGGNIRKVEFAVTELPNYMKIGIPLWRIIEFIHLFLFFCKCYQ